MSTDTMTSPETLLQYSFLWSLIRLPIAALALFLGGIPPVLYFIRVPALYGLIGSLLAVAWFISGFASLYLTYRWNKAGHTVFGGKNSLDVAAFLICVVSGINLGLAAAVSRNLGMQLAGIGGPSLRTLLFYATGALYIASAYHLHKRWKERSEQLF